MEELQKLKLLYRVVPLWDALQDRKGLKFPEPYTISPSLTWSLTSYSTADRSVSIAPGWDWFDKNFCLLGKKSQMHCSMYEVPNNWTISRLSTLPNQACACRSHIHRCRYMTRTGPACSMAVFQGKALTALKKNFPLIRGPKTLASERKLIVLDNLRNWLNSFHSALRLLNLLYIQGPPHLLGESNAPSSSIYSV